MSKGVVSKNQEGLWYYDVRVNGKRKRRTFNTKKEAQEGLKKAKAGKEDPPREHSKKFWDNKKLLQMRDEILPNSRTIQEAMRKAQDKWSRNIDRSHFVSKFTKHFGHPPKQYIGIKAGPIDNPFPDLPPNMNPVILLQKNKDLEKEIDKMSKELAEQNSYRAEIEEIVDGVKRTARKAEELFITEPTGRSFHGIPTLAMGDVHYCDNLDPNVSLSGLGYSRAEAKKRLIHTATRSCEVRHTILAKAHYKCIVLTLLGDMFSGYIREQLRENSDLPILPAITEMLDILISCIDLLRKEYGKVYVPCVPGNHSRLDKKPRSINYALENYEWILYYMLRRHYRTLGIDDVQVIVPKGHEYRYRIYNTRYLITHGFEFKGGNGITGPLLPWMRGYQKKQQQSASATMWSGIEKNFDIMVMAHFHQSAFLEFLGVIVNGPIVEMGEYPMIAQYPYSPSCSNYWLTHPEKGVQIPLKIFAVKGQSIHGNDEKLPDDVVPVFGDKGWEKS